MRTLFALAWLMRATVCFCADDGTELARAFAEKVDLALDLPDGEKAHYGELLAKAVAGKNITADQYFVLVDRNKFVQAVMIYWMSADKTVHFVGASPASTGKPGSFDHFVTPLGVFEHSIDNLDFRALGTRNENGIRGYGSRGSRVFDFGWQQAIRGWGRGGEGTMRLQMHATDPDFLEQLLGSPQSEGCVRIPATFDAFLDHYGILDGGYEAAMATGRTFWVLPKDREATRWSGRYLVIVDSGRIARPIWCPGPAR